jgi:hypothetical protein
MVRNMVKYVQKPVHKSKCINTCIFYVYALHNIDKVINIANITIIYIIYIMYKVSYIIIFDIFFYNSIYW